MCLGPDPVVWYSVACVTAYAGARSIDGQPGARKGKKKDPSRGPVAETERFELSVPLRELHLSRVVH